MKRQHFHFCTYFDCRYLARALALHASLTTHCRNFTLWALCLDEDTHRILSELSLPFVELVPLAALETDDPELLAAKANRSLIEFYFTCTPAFPLNLLRQRPEIDLITYLDADIWFFGDPVPVFAEIGASSVGIIPHRFSARLRSLEIYGIYNVGWVSFRRDVTGLECLGHWRSRCLASCSDNVSTEGFADQKYLDDWPRRFNGVSIITHKGANLAPWNVENYRVGARGKTIYVDEDPLVFYHFHGLRRIDRWLFESGLGTYEATLSAAVRGLIYRPYLRQLGHAAARLAPFGVAELLPTGIRPNEPSRGAQQSHRGAFRSVLGRVAPWKNSRILVLRDLVL